MFASGKTAAVSGGAPDAQFNYVTMLLHGDGTNGAQNNTFLDSSTNNFTITRNGNTTQGSFSPYGSNWSNYFGIADNVNRTLSISPSGLSAMTTWTIECFTYSTTASWNDQAILGPWGPNLIRTSIEVLEVYLAGSQRFGIANGLPKNQWNHLAICCDSSGLRLYVNGTRIGNDTGLPNLSISLANMIIGAEATTSTSNDRWNGYISNFRVLNGTALYTGATYTVPTTALTAITNTALLICQSNRFKDSSANNFAITVNGTPSVQRFNPFGASTAYSTSVIGGSGYFDGSGDYLDTPSSSQLTFGTNDFTIEFWIKTTNTNFNIMNPASATGSGYWGLLFQSGNLRWNDAYNTTNLFAISASAILDGAWHHVAICRSSGSTKVYYDGVLQTTQSDSTNYSGVASWRIGYGNVTYFNGYLSDFRVSNNAAFYTSAFTPPTAPLTAISQTSLLLNYTNGAIFDNAMMNDLETVGNAQISTSVVKYGTGSLYFDGSGDWMSTVNKPPINLEGDFTVEAWLYQAVSGTNSPPIALGSDTFQNGTFFIYINTNQNLGIYVNGSVTLGSTAATVATWHHVAMVRSGSTITGYLNGTSQFTITNSVTFSGPIELGSSVFAGTRYYGNGYIDDLRITKGYARYTANFTPPTAAFSNTGPI